MKSYSGFSAAAGCFLQQRFKAAFRFAGKNGDAKLAGAIEIDGGAVEHGNAAGDVKAADDDRNAGGAERPRDVERAGILVGLHTDEPDHAETIRRPETAQQLGDIDPGIGLIDDVDNDIDVGSEHAAPRAIERHAMQRGQRIRRHQSAPPADDVAVIVIVRGFDEHDAETAPRLHGRQGMCHRTPEADPTWPRARREPLFDAPASPARGGEKPCRRRQTFCPLIVGYCPISCPLYSGPFCG